MSAPAAVAEPPATPPISPTGDGGEYMKAFAAKSGFDLPPDAPAGDTPAPENKDVAETPAPEGATTLDAPKVTPPAADPPKNDNKTQAANRVRAAELEKELTELKARLEPLNSELTTERTRAAELKALADQREIELKKHQERYQNETSQLDESLLPELPVVREAMDKFNSVAASFFPSDISNPALEESDRRFDPKRLNQTQMRGIEDMVNRWRKEEFDSNNSPELRSGIQHIAISNIAKAMGVSPESFTPKVIGGQEYSVISPAHPVYQHLKNQVPAYVRAKIAYEGATVQARENRTQAMQDLFSKRRENTSKMYQDSGVGLTGENLKAALERNPASPILSAMKLVENDPDLLKELKDNIEHETALNAVFRPHLDLVDPDLDSRNQAALAHNARIGMRAIQAPLAPVIMKLAQRQATELAEVKAQLADIQAKYDKTLLQAEPGGGGPAGLPDSTTPTAFNGGDLGDHYYRKALDKVGQPAR